MVPFSLTRYCSRWSLRADIYQVWSEQIAIIRIYTDKWPRRKPDAQSPWHLISNEEDDIKAMKRAAVDPKLVMVSDWTRFMSWEYMAAEESSGMAIL